MLPFKKKTPKKDGMPGVWKGLLTVIIFIVVIILCFVGFRLVEYCSD